MSVGNIYVKPTQLHTKVVYGACMKILNSKQAKQKNKTFISITLPSHSRIWTCENRPEMSANKNMQMRPTKAYFFTTKLLWGIAPDFFRGLTTGQSNNEGIMLALHYPSRSSTQCWQANVSLMWTWSKLCIVLPCVSCPNVLVGIPARMAMTCTRMYDRLQCGIYLRVNHTSICTMS